MFCLPKFPLRFQLDSSSLPALTCCVALMCRVQQLLSSIPQLIAPQTAMALKIKLKLFPHYQEGAFPELPKNIMWRFSIDKIDPCSKQPWIQKRALRPQQLLLVVDTLASNGGEQFAIK